MEPDHILRPMIQVFCSGWQLSATTYSNKIQIQVHVYYALVCNMPQKVSIFKLKYIVFDCFSTWCKSKRTKKSDPAADRSVRKLIQEQYNRLGRMT